MAEDRVQIEEELQRTAVLKKSVSKLPPDRVLSLAIEFFRDKGYRADSTGRPGHVFVMGKREGILPRVTGEVSARADVGKAGTTLVTLDAAGEQLGPAMLEFIKYLRSHKVSQS